MPSVTYKSNTDIMEESQQYQVALGLLSAGAKLYVFPDPLIPMWARDRLMQQGAQFVTSEVLQEQGIQVYHINIWLN